MAAKVFSFRKGFSALVILLLLTGIISGCVNPLLPKETRIIRGVHIRGVELGNATKAEALEKINFLKDSIEEDTVTLVYRDLEWEFQAQELGVEVQGEKIVAKALQYGHQGSFLDQFRERRRIAKAGMEVPLYFTIDKGKLRNLLTKVTEDLRIPPRNASFRVKPDDTIEIIPGQEGTDLDYEDPYRKLHKIIAEAAEPVIQLRMVVAQPEQTTEDIRAMKLKGLVSSFSTTFSLAKANRSFNIMVATKPFTNVLVKPGEIISFNKIVGPRSMQNGYKPAPVILKGKLVDGLGGGVCQVSTTLFNAALLANLEIVKRSNHTLPVSYVPIGRDATVVYDTIDLQIRNNTGGYILIKAFVFGDTVTFKIYGDTDKRKDILLTSETTEVIPSTKVEYEQDPNYPKGKTYVKAEPTPGYKAKAYRIIRENGRIVKKELIANSYYKPQPKIIAVGTNPKAKLKEAPAKPQNPGPGANQPGPPNTPPTGTAPPTGAIPPGGVAPPAGGNPPSSTPPSPGPAPPAGTQPSPESPAPPASSPVPSNPAPEETSPTSPPANPEI